jgi:lysophospholipase L1-like esterase
VYLRFAALGDSATVGIGDPVPGGWRGWSRLLAAALGTSYDVSYCNLAVPGATATDVLRGQLGDAVTHRPDLASLVVGVNDTMRAGWHPGRLRDELMTCAAALHDTGATLLTARFHDHGAVFGLPGVLRRPLRARIEVVNEVYDEVHATFGGHRLDLAARSDVLDRTFWSVDRLHPSELGHRALARAYADQLAGAGLVFEPPSLEPAGGQPVGWRQDVAWLVTEGAPWVGRRARDLGPWAVRMAWEETRPRRTPVS